MHGRRAARARGAAACCVGRLRAETLSCPRGGGGEYDARKRATKPKRGGRIQAHVILALVTHRDPERFPDETLGRGLANDAREPAGGPLLSHRHVNRPDQPVALGDPRDVPTADDEAVPEAVDADPDATPGGT